MQCRRHHHAQESSRPRFVVIAALALGVVACQSPADNRHKDRATAEASALVPDYTSALESNRDNYIAFLKAWFHGATPEIESSDIVRYALSGSDKAADLAAQRLVSGNEAFCSQAGGKILQEPPAMTCVVADGRTIGRLAVQAFHATPEQSGMLQFTGESAAWIARLNQAQLADYRRVIDTLAGNGVSGGVLLSTGENFEAVRFGRLSGPDFYALKTPNHGLVWFEDIVSVKWTLDTITIMQRTGEQIEDTGKGLTPGTTIVRLLPTASDQLKAESLSFENPFRFVSVATNSRQPRQIRIRNDALIVQITVAGRSSKYHAGIIPTRFDKAEASAFRKALVTEARKAAANTGKKTETLNVYDPKLRADLDQLGRAGPCGRTQSEDRLRAGDIAYREYLVCVEYRQEVEAVKANGGALTPDKTPLLYLGRVARAPWYNFNGVLQ